MITPPPIPPLRLHNCQMWSPSHSIEWGTCCFCKRFLPSFLSSPLHLSSPLCGGPPLTSLRSLSIRLYNPIIPFILSFPLSYHSIFPLPRPPSLSTVQSRIQIGRIAVFTNVKIMRNKIGGDETECFGCKGSYNQQRILMILSSESLFKKSLSTKCCAFKTPVFPEVLKVLWHRQIFKIRLFPHPAYLMKSFSSVCFHWFSKTDLKKDPKADLSVVTNLRKWRMEMIDFSLRVFLVAVSIDFYRVWTFLFNLRTDWILSQKRRIDFLVFYKNDFHI